MKRRIHQGLKSLFLALILISPALGYADAIDESPSAGAMTADAVIARPVLFAATGVGFAIFVASSPFSALGGNINEAWNVLVDGPFEAGFIRCLGCKKNGRKSDKVVQQQ